MAIKVKPVADVVKKWVEVTPGRSTYYLEEASIAGDDWEKGATAAAAAFAAAVKAANIEALFKGGIKRAGAAKFARKVKAVGASRFVEGIPAAQDDYKNGIEPMLATIAAITLAARQPRGTLGNWERSRIVGVELNKKRLALRAAGAA